MPGETFLEKKEENISIHIFSVSAGMVGVCITVISLLNISTALRKIETFGDNIIAFGAMIFLAACLISYMGIRTKSRKRRFIMERAADGLFLSGLSLLVVVCLLIVWTFV